MDEGGGGQGRLEVFQKNINIWADGRPLQGGGEGPIDKRKK